MKITPFDRYGDVGRIGVRLAPLDVGFDLRATGHVVRLPPGTKVASYGDRARSESDDDRYVVEGTASEIACVLRNAGYRIETEEVRS